MGILDGRKAIVVGASSGVGYGCALRFAEEGAEVLACARRLDRLEGLAADAAGRGFPGKITAMTCDVTVEEDIDRVVSHTREELGRIDILACIAQGGMRHQTYLMETTAEDAFEYYTGGPLYTLRFMQKVFPVMKEQHYGRIITCASHGAVTGQPGFTAYDMAKGAIMALTRIAAHEWAKEGIVTNCFLPVVQNELYGQDPQSTAAREQLEEIIPVGYFGKAYEDAS
ncbi:MAG TPA: SDR family oxidoreductase, partial [Solirubrobacterales bacterium]|nr:SDR family oxidoreductase [Solirubrobacterales bacterium]